MKEVNNSRYEYTPDGDWEDEGPMKMEVDSVPNMIKELEKINTIKDLEPLYNTNVLIKIAGTSISIPFDAVIYNEILLSLRNYANNTNRTNRTNGGKHE